MPAAEQRPAASTSAVYAREQIAIPSYTLNVLKEYQKATLRHFRGRKAVSAVALVDFSLSYFGRKDAALKARQSRQEEYRREWSGNKGEVRKLFAQFDVNGDGTIEFRETENALGKVSSFFGYTMEENMHPEWVPTDEVGAKALFSQLDVNEDGHITWDEFWAVVSEWMDANFDVTEVMREKSVAETLLRSRAAEEDLHTQEQEAESVAAAAEKARLELASTLKREADEKARAERLAAERAASDRRAEDEAAEKAVAAETASRCESDERLAASRATEHALEALRLQAEAEADAARRVLEQVPSSLASPARESEHAAARREALELVQLASVSAKSVSDLLPSLIAALGTAGTTGAGPMDCGALRRAALAKPPEWVAPLFVAVAPAEEQGEEGEATPLMTVVWATAAHPYVQPGRALQRITELPVELAAFCLAILEEPPPALLKAAAAGDSSVFVTYAPSAEELGLSLAGAEVGEGGIGNVESFIASDPLVRIRLIVDTAAGAGAVLGLIGVGPEAARFESLDADDEKSGKEEKGEEDVVLQVLLKHFYY
ncbi:hypothetical protein T492DRAFT_836048 [Pavlovales sp. CCMP2436]|nr:hypothetical protein T492DRAFT_836048 [Pavlovales sp. CCMP2436]